MTCDLTPIFKKYENLRAEADAIFTHIAASYPECVACAPGCSDCCSALFDLPLVEAMYINEAFKATFDYGKQRSDILEKAAGVDRALARLKKEIYHMEKDGAEPERIMAKIACERMPCPLLDEKNECLMYGNRPITCRLYGIPQQIGSDSHVCGYSRFNKGDSYPAVQVGKIQQRLDALGEEIAKEIGSRFKLTEIYVPLSMALLTDYDDQYLGIGQEEGESKT